ncbi:MBL fold metallo-hydrolase [Methylocystis sp. JAN1]|uniref:MBL fold metallo-hydrolase n=1 Tax=Methylocystis sp. JAN1 TaxID=3397211 RepID=UPI003FA229A3
MTLTVTILGCASSGGVPRVGQGWGRCNPDNPRNRRRRCSILVAQGDREAAATQVLVDTGPDLREQLIDADVKRLDAVLYTHPHADHTHGIDDVRGLVIRNGRRIPAYMDEPTAREVTHKFGYIFVTPPGSFYPPLMTEHRLRPGRPVTIEGPGGSLEATPFRLDHGDMDALGFRFGGVAYTPDLNAIPPESSRFLEGLDLWIIDALRWQRHGTHLSVEQALAFIDLYRPKRAVLTDLHVDLDYDALAAVLPANVEPAYDGMRIEV